MSEIWDEEIIAQEEQLLAKHLRGLSRRAIAEISRETGREPEELYRTVRGERWFRIGESSQAQEEVIREYATKQGYPDLRGFWKVMQSEGWDYYDVLKIYYGR